MAFLVKNSISGIKNSLSFLTLRNSILKNINHSAFRRSISTNDYFMCLGVSSKQTCDMRTIHTTAVQFLKKARINLTFLYEGQRVTAVAKEGESIYDVVARNSLPFPGYGSCEGTLSCSTCHVIFKEKDFKLLEEPAEDELDMLDIVVGFEETSRLGCQVKVTKEMEGVEILVPSVIHDIRQEDVKNPSES